MKTYTIQFRGTVKVEADNDALAREVFFADTINMNDKIAASAVIEDVEDEEERLKRQAILDELHADVTPAGWEAV